MITNKKENETTPVYQPTDEESTLISSVIETYEAYADQTQGLRSDWEDIYKAWQLYLDDSKYPWRSKLYVPLLMWTIETITPRLISNYPSISAKGVEKEDDVKGKFISKFLDFQFRNTMDMRKKLMQATKSMLLYGVGIGKITWETRTREYQKKKKFLKVLKYQKKVKETLYDDPVFEPCSIFDIYTDPKSPTLAESEWVIQRFEMNLSELKKKTKIYENLEYVTAADTLNENDGGETSSTLDSVDLSSSSKSGSKKVVLLEAWSNDRVVTIANPDNGGVLLRDMENPYEHGMKPFIEMHCFDSPEPNRFYTPGVGTVVIDLQHGLNTTANQMIDNINLSINKMFKMRRGANINRAELVTRPGGVIQVDDLQDLQEFQVQSIDTSAKYLLDTYLYWAQNTTGATDLARGLDVRGTATEASIQDKNTNTRFSLLQTAVSEFIAQAGKMILKLDQQYIQNTRTIRIFDDEWRKDVYIYFGEGELDGDFDLEVQADSTVLMDKAVMNKQLLDSFGIFGRDPEVRLNKQEAAKRWYENAGFNDVDSLFMEEQTQPQGQPGIPQGAPQQGGEDLVALAEQENQRMLQGEELPPTEGATPEHTQVHAQMQDNPIIAKHMDGEMDAMEGQGQAPQAMQAPQTGAGLSMEDQVRSAYSPVSQV